MPLFAAVPRDSVLPPATAPSAAAERRCRGGRLILDEACNERVEIAR